MGASPAVNLTARDIASILGRNQGPELFFQQAFATLTSPIIPKPVNVNRPLERFHIVWRGRVVIGVANFTAVAAEAPQTIIQRIRLIGTHKRFGSLVPVDLTGATTFVLMRLFREGRGNSEYITTGAGQPTRQAEPSVPFAQTLANFGNTGTYDIEIHYSLPVAPILPSSSRIAVVPFLFQQTDWADTLQLQLFFGDQTSFGTPGGTTTTTFSSFGSGSGSPLVSIFTNYDILGPLATSIASAVVLRSEQLSTTLTAIANNQRVQLLQKQKTTNIIVKSGVLLTGTSGGVQVYASLSDTILDFTQPIVDNKPIRNNFSNFAQKEYAGLAFSTVLPQGYINFTFLDSLNPLTYYRGDLLAGGSTFELDTNVVSANANNGVAVIQEQVIGDPVGGAAS
jgi:hypothetical protein